MGRLLLKNRQIFFEYDSAFIKKGLELSPFKLPLKAGVIVSKDKMFEGLLECSMIACQMVGEDYF